MLPGPHRLRLKADFERVYRSGRSWALPLAALHVAPRPGGARVGVVVSKKVGKAVQRNRVRRRLREIVRAKLPGWKEGFDAVVVARAGAAGAEFRELAESLEELARRAHLVRQDGAPAGAEYTLPPGGRAGRSRNGPSRQSPAAARAEGTGGSG
jgi:ribonuclease P protein component